MTRQYVSHVVPVACTLLALAAALGAGLPAARAGTAIYWDPTGTATVTGGGSGTWAASAGTWYSSSGSADVNWTDTTGTATAVFGGTTAGTVTIGSSGVTANGLTFSTAGYLLTGSTITLAGTTPTIAMGTSGGTISSTTAGTAGLMVTGSSLLDLTGVNIYTGGTTLSGGSLQIGGSGSLGSGSYSGVISDAGTLIFNTSTNQTLSGVISGAGKLVQNGSGLLNLSGANTYSGGTSLAIGSIILKGGTGTLGSGAVTLSGGGLGFNPGSSSTSFTYANAINVTANATIASDDGLTYLSGPISVASGDNLLLGTAGWSGKNLYINGAISGAGSLSVKSNSLTLDNYSTSSGAIVYLNGANTYSGGTTIVNGTLAINGAGSLGNGSYSGPIANAGTLVFSTLANQVLSGPISGGGALQLAGPGTVAFSGGTASQTFGNFTVSGPSAINITPNSGNNSTLTVGNSWTRSNNGTLFVNLSSGSGTLASNPTLTGSVVPWAAVQDTTGFGYATVSGGNVVRYTPSTLLPATGAGSGSDYGLTGTVGNSQTLTQSETCNSLTLSPGAAGATLNLSGNTLSLTNNILVYDGTNNPYAITGTTGSQLGTAAATQIIMAAGPNALTIATPISSGAGALTLAGNGTGIVILTATNSYTGTTAVGAGTLQLGINTPGSDGVLAGNVALSNSASVVYDIAGSQSLSYTISGTGNLTMAGTGTLTLPNGSAIYGTTTVSGGTLVLGTGNGGSGGYLVNSSIVIGPNGEMDLPGTDTTGYGVSLPMTIYGMLKKTYAQSETLYRPITLSGGTMTSTGTGYSAAGAWNLFGNSITTAANTNNYISGVAGFATRTGGTYFNLGTASTLNISVPVIGDGTSFNVEGPGTMILSGSNTDTSAVQIGYNSTPGNLAFLGTSASTLTSSVQLSSSSNLSFQGNSVTTFTATGDGNFQVGYGSTMTISQSANVTIASDLKLGSNVSGSSGNVVQSGGTLTITDTTTNRPLCIGEYSNETSSYTLSGGSLSVLGGPTYDPYNGSSGILAISGGTASLKEVIVGSGSGYNGTLAISGGGALYVGTGGLVNNGGSATVSINNGTLGAYANWSSSLAMSLTGGATVDSGSNTIALSGVLSGTGSLSKIGNGLLTLSGANTYSGPTTVSGGTLALNNSSASVDTYNGGNIAINNGSTLEVTYTGTDGQYNFGGKTFTFDSNGGGTILTGSNVNFVSTSANTFATSGGAQDTIGGLSVVNMNGVGINFNLTRGTGASDLKVTTGLDNSSGGLNLTGNGILELDVVNSYTGGTAISGGTLLIASGGVLGGGSYSGAIANSGTLVFNTSTNQTLNGSISGIGSLVEAGPGALALASNYSTYTGGTTVNGGVLNINYSPNSGTGTIRGNLTINAGGKVSINAHDVFGYTSAAVSLSTLNINGGTLDQNAGVTNETFTGVAVTMTGGLWSTSGGGDFDMFSAGYGTGVPTVTTIASSNQAVISANLNFRSGNPLFTVGAGTVPGGIDLVASGQLTSTSGTSYGFVKAGPGVMAITGGINNYNGGTSIQAGTLMIGSGGTTGSLGSNTTVSDSATLTFNRSDNGLVFANAISGPGGVTQIGSGLTKVTGANSYTGGTTLSAGTLQVGATLALGSTAGGLTVSGGTLDLNAISPTVGAVSLAGGAIVNNSTYSTLTGSSYILQNGVVSAALGGATAGVNAAGGLVILSGSNTYGGGTTVSGGTLQLGANAALGLTSGALNVGGGTLNINGVSPTVGAVTLASGAIVNSGLGGTLTGGSYNLQSGLVSATLGGPTASVTKTTAGVATLNSANTYGGGTTVSGGTLVLGNATALGSTAAPLTANNGVLDLEANSITVGSLAGANGTITSNSAGATPTLTVNLPSGASTFSGTIANGLGTVGLTKTGAGLLILAGSNNNYSGPTLLNAGTLAVGAAGTLGTGNLTVTPGALLDVSAYGTAGYTLNLAGGTFSAGRASAFATDINGTLNLQSATMNLAGGNTGTLTVAGGGFGLSGGTLNYQMGDVIATQGAITFGGSDYIQPLATMGTGSYTIFTGSSVPSSVANLAMSGPFGSNGRQTYIFGTSGGTAVTLTVSGMAGNLQWLGAASGTWDTQTTQNWYNASPNVNGPDLFFGGDNVTFSDSGSVSPTVSISGTVTPATVTFNNNAVPYTLNGPGSIGNGGWLLKTGTGSLTINTSNTYAGGTSLMAGTITTGTSNTLGSGPLNVSGGTLAANYSESISSLALSGGVVNAAAAGALGAGPVAMSGGVLNAQAASAVGGAVTVSGGVLNDGAANSLGGGTLVVGGGTVNAVNAQSVASVTLSSGLLNLGSASALGSGQVSILGGSLNNTSGGPLTLTSNNAQTWSGSFTFVGSNPLNLGTGAVSITGPATVTVTASTLTVPGALSGPGSLAMNGGGTLVLSASNSYLGGTTVSGGTLAAAADYALAGGALGMNPASGTALVAFSSATPTIGGLASSGAGSSQILLGNAAGSATVLTVGNGNGGGTFAGLISDLSTVNAAAVGSLVKVGTGTLVLSANNTFTGGATVSGGTLQLSGGSGSTPEGRGMLTINTGATASATVGDDNQLGLETAGYLVPLNIAGGTFLAGNNEHVNAITMAGGTLGVASGASQASGMDLRAYNSVNPTITALANTTGGTGATISSKMTLDAPATVNVASAAAGNALSISGVLAGTGSLAKTGPGLLTLSNANNTFTGGTTISAGTLTVAVGGGNYNSALGEGQSVSVGAGGTLLLAAGDALGYYNANPTTLAINGGVMTVAAGVHDSIGYYGITMNAGTLTSQGAGDATGNYILDGNITTLANASPSVVSAQTIYLRGNGSSGTITFNVAHGSAVPDLLVSSVISQGIPIVKSGPGLMTLTGSNIYTGATSINAGTLQIGNGGSTGALAGNGPISISSTATLAFFESTNGLTVANTISGSGPIDVLGTGTSAQSSYTFSATSSGYTGPIAVNNARLSLPGNIFANASMITVVNNGSDAGQIYAYGGGTVATPATISGNGWTESAGNLGAIRLEGGTTWAGPITLAGNARIGSYFTSSNAITGTITGPSTAQLEYWGGNQTETITVTPAAQNTYGTTEISGTIVVVAGNTYALSSGALLMNGGTFEANGNNFAFPNLSGTSGNIQNGSTALASTVTVGSDNTSTTYGGTLANGSTGTLTFVKTGTGNLTLSAASTNPVGNYIINGGTLTATASNGGLGQNVGTRTIYVNPGATVNMAINNVFGGSGMSAANLPTIAVTGGVLNETRYNAIGNVTLSGGTLLNNASDTSTYTGFQFLGTVTVSGTASSYLATTSNKACELLGASAGGTTFNVGVTGAAGADLIVSAPLQNASADYNTLAGGLVKTGAGTMVLTATSTYTGGTSVNAGTLLVNGALGNAPVTVAGGAMTVNGSVGGGPITVGSGALLTVDSTGIVGNGGISVSGGTLAVAGNVTGGTVAINGGSVLGGTGAIAGPVIVASGAGAANQGTINLVDGAIGTLTLSNTGNALTLGTGSGTAVMDFEMSAGTTDLLNVSVGSLTLNGTVAVNMTQLSGSTIGLGTYNLMNFSGGTSGSGNFVLDPIAGLSSTLSASLTETANSLQLVIVNGIPQTAYWLGAQSGSWSNTGNWAKDSGGTSTVGALPGSGQSAIYFTATGGGNLATTMDSDFSVTSVNFVPGSAAVTISGTNTLTIASGINDNATNPQAINANVALGAAQTWSVAAGGTLSVGGVISSSLGASSNGLTLTGPGTVVLANANTYTGGTTVNGGVLQLGDGVSLNGSVTGNIADNGLLVFANGTTQAYAGAITGSGGLTVAGPGTLTLGGGNGYSGGTTVNGGGLVLGNVNALGTGGLVLAGGAMDLGDNSIAVPSISLTGGTLTGSGQTLTISGSNPIDAESGAASANLAGSVGLSKTTAGTVLLSGNNSYIGGTSIEGGVLQLGSDAALPNSDSLSVNSGTLDLNGHNPTVGTVAGVGLVSNSSSAAATINVNATAPASLGVTLADGNGTTGLIKSGSGTLILANSANSYSGGTTVSRGVLQLGNATALGSANGGLTVNSGTLDLAGNSPTVGALQSALATGVVASSTGPATLTAGAGNATSAFNGVIIDGVGPVSLVKTGSGTLTLTGANGYGGGTTVSGGELSISSSSNLGSGNVTIGTGALQTTGTVMLDAARTITLTDPSSTIDTPNSTDHVTITGLVTGSGALNKIGAGTLALANPSGDTYAGDTNVAAGTLLVAADNALSPASTLVVGDGASVILDFGGGAGNDIVALRGGVPSLATPGLAVAALAPAGISTVPEPSTLALLLVGAVASLLAWRRRR